MTEIRMAQRAGPAAKAAYQPRHIAHQWLLGMLITVLMAISAHAVRAQDAVTKSHGYSVFDTLKYAEGFTHFDYVNPNAPKGGVFSTWAFGTFDSLSPYILKGSAAVGAAVFFDTLLAGNLEESDAGYGLVAESIEFPQSREWVIFNMRPEARFADGSTVTAQDVVFSHQILLDKGRPTFKTAFKDILSVEALDDHRVKFTFSPDGALRELILTAGAIPIFSEAYYADRDFAESSLEAPMGSGPYELLEVDPGRSVSYKRRDDYWAKDLPVNVGSNNFDVLKFEYFSDYTSAFEAFKGGAYLYREEFSSKVWATGYNFPAVDSGAVQVESLPDGRPAGTQGWWFNLRRDKFADPRVREAIGIAFNFEWSNASLFYDLYARTDSFWENSSTLQASGMPGPEELAILEPLRDVIPEAVFTQEAFVPAVMKSDSLADRRALRRAGKLLDDAGWTVGSDGQRYKDGEKLSFEILNDSPTFDRVINPFVENLRRLGIDVTSNRVDPAEAQEREKVFDYDMVTQRYSMSQSPGDELQQVFGSATANAQGSANVAGIANEGVDALIEIISNAKSREELEISVRALDRVLRAMHVWIPQWYKGSHSVAYFDIYERPYSDTPPPLGLGSSSIWWVNPDKEAALRASGVLR